MNICTFKDQGTFKSQLRDALAKLLGLTNKEKASLHVDFYGLTGVGLQKQDGNVKIMARYHEL